MHLQMQELRLGNFPFCTVEDNVGVIPIADDRLHKIAELVKPEKITPTFLEVLDIAGACERSV